MANTSAIPTSVNRVFGDFACNWKIRVDLCGSLWIFVDICGYLWIFVDICRYSIQSYLHAGRPILY